MDLTRGSNTRVYAYYAGTNKVQNFDGSVNDYGYDSNANVTSSSPKSINTIAYDTFTQRPASVSMSSGASLALEYGGDTQRVLKNYTSGGSTNSRLYLHGANDYPLIEKNKTSATSETLAVYIYGLNGAVAKRVGSTVLFLLKDHLGSNRVVMDATGLVRTYYDYDALGNVIRIGTTNEVKYQFTGQEYDESGVHNYRARLYDSDLGKFYGVDPAGQGWSPFVYAGNNYIIAIDPDGQAFFLAPIFIGAAIGAIWGGATYAITPGIEGFSWGGFFSAAGIGALGGALGGAASLLAPAGIIPGALYGAGTGGVIGGLTSELSGGSFGSGFVAGAIGGGIGGGLGGYHQAKALERNIWTGAAPDAVPAPIPLSAPAGNIPIRATEQADAPATLKQLDVAASQVDELADVLIAPKTPTVDGIPLVKDLITSKGVVRISANPVIEGNTIHLKDFSVFPTGRGRLILGHKEVLELRRILIAQARSQGFNELRISGFRITGSNPNRLIDVRIKIK